MWGIARSMRSAMPQWSALAKPSKVAPGSTASCTRTWPSLKRLVRASQRQEGFRPAATTSHSGNAIKE